MKTPLQRISENFNLHSLTIPEKTRRMSVYRSDNLTYVDSGLSCDTFNVIHILNGAALSRDEINTCLEHYRKKHLMYCIWISEENLNDNVKSIFQELNLNCKNTEPGMELDLFRYQEREDPLHLKQSFVRNYAELNDYAWVIAANWNPPDHNVLTYYDKVSEHILNKNNRILLAAHYENDKPVSVLELFPSDNTTIGVYGLATLASYRGRGIGTSLLTFALNKAKDLGYKWAVLQASDKGVAIYQRLGFKVHNHYYEYA